MSTKDADKPSRRVRVTHQVSRSADNRLRTLVAEIRKLIADKVAGETTRIALDEGTKDELDRAHFSRMSSAWYLHVCDYRQESLSKLPGAVTSEKYASYETPICLQFLVGRPGVGSKGTKQPAADLYITGGKSVAVVQAKDEFPDGDDDQFTQEDWNEIKRQALQLLAADALDSPEAHSAYLKKQLAAALQDVQ